jgi:hypothetical protein
MQGGSGHAIVFGQQTKKALLSDKFEVKVDTSEAGRSCTRRGGTAGLRQAAVNLAPNQGYVVLRQGRANLSRQAASGGFLYLCPGPTQMFKRFGQGQLRGERWVSKSYQLIPLNYYFQ